ncbi:MAG: hypothetical protein A2445_03540 [Candidatus Jacksonbacteria bacterium RIFOXYC2_FULL_44_29]|nr:MAG: hypothetical protein UW45_C0031G0009 [Parcubacteria group bacterium GW2011_GWC2_44_22]OGY75469.1 MAG: hypothetical protein A2240_03065 [Candidatus Jacksonbacteria bacterium RIFOXYA2_FULL_43_12]OGY76964.1 MAG: hypothetical protein A2295_01175 [Candidatus Jacksonbacteria bacterium RIFOXYB2_FULL_44_15]OGY79124.1 MAG: hypothetical protein A2550_01435 [Candidatus Jacksonbacteria bacterium RIFOXYD2_FULL_43_21]OGY80499.1 MAG: hypothetical protein A2445_03540 [Candidatus Jacksonbacteria bacteri
MGMQIQFKKNILLTGAGFTANFGGLLAREMWSKIFNSPKLDSLSQIKKMMRKDFNFENVYSAVLRDNNYINEFQQIIIDCYVDMDSTLKNYTFTVRDPYGVNWYGVRKLISLFAGTGQEIGACFTLNQDLFLERKSKHKPLGLQERLSSDTYRAVLPDQKYIDDFKERHLSSLGNFQYIKLHGSYGWLTSYFFSKYGEDHRMVLGINKYEEIINEPLLKWYFELFEQAICREGVKLLIIGYGFRDEHINKCLVQAISGFGAKIYIISPEDSETLRDRLIGKPECSSQLWKPEDEGSQIWNAIAGYFPYELKTIFPSDQSETHIKKDIFKIFNE